MVYTYFNIIQLTCFLFVFQFTNIRSFIDKSLFDDQCMIADKGWGVTNYDDYVTRITDDYLLYRSPIFAFDVITYCSPHMDNPYGGIQTSTSAAAASSSVEGKQPVLLRQYRVLSAGITFRFNQTFLQVRNAIKTTIDSYDSTVYSSNVEKAENNITRKASKQNATIQTEHVNVVGSGGMEGVAESTKVDSHVSNEKRQRNSVLKTEGSPKLHPPLVEDYDALMQGIPLCKYKVQLKRIRIELYAKTEPELPCRVPCSRPRERPTSPLSPCSAA